jgi:UDP-GlcNAc:undecaprenyl-phosphate GlcNAc-1-phosphate transferase
MLFALIAVAEKRGWRWQSRPEAEAQADQLAARLHRLAMRFVRLTVPAFLVTASLAATHVSFDFGVAAVAILLMVFVSLLLRKAPGADWLLRLALFCSAAAVTYLAPATGVDGSVLRVLQDAYLVMLALAIAVAVRFGAGQGFATTPLDVLLVIAVVAAGTLGFFDVGGGISAGLLLRLAVLFYGCELTVSSARNPARANQWSLIGVALVLLGKILSVA